ncbi:MAG: hypothetical protein ACTHU0_18205 [Kofleriaceae bacterium]
MSLETFHVLAKGISRLCCAPSDLDVARSQGKPKPLAKASKAHRAIFENYLAELRPVYDSTATWWSSLIDAQQGEGMSRQDAIDAAFDRRLAGPASAPEVVSLVRKTWLECTALNDTLDESDRVPPEVVLLGWLMEGKYMDFVTLITCMPYWPLGLDENGNWC